MKDLEVVSLALTAEYMGINSENHLFHQLPVFLSNKIEHSIYKFVPYLYLKVINY